MKRIIQTEHAGAKKGQGHWGRKKEAKQISRKRRRENAKYSIKLEKTFMAKRKPTTPGEEYLSPLGLTQKELAHHIDYDVKVINRLINNRTSVTAQLALKLAAALNTSPEFWLNAQKAVDIYEASKSIGKLPKALIINGHLAPI